LGLISRITKTKHGSRLLKPVQCVAKRSHFNNKFTLNGDICSSSIAVCTISRQNPLESELSAGNHKKNIHVDVRNRLWLMMKTRLVNAMLDKRHSDNIRLISRITCWQVLV